MLIGMNGFDFGQIVAVIGIIIPIALIARANFDYDDAWDTKRSLWAKEAKNNQAGPVEDSVDLHHDSLPDDWVHGDPIPSRTPSTRSRTHIHRSTPLASHSTHPPSRSTPPTSHTSPHLHQPEAIDDDDRSPHRSIHARRTTSTSTSDRFVDLPRSTVTQEYHSDSEHPWEIPSKPPKLEFRENFKAELNGWSSGATEAVFNRGGSQSGRSQRGRHLSAHAREEE